MSAPISDAQSACQTGDAIERSQYTREAVGLMVTRVKPGELSDSVPLWAIHVMMALAGLLSIVMLLMVHGDLLSLSPMAGAYAERVVVRRGCSRHCPATR